MIKVGLLHRVNEVDIVTHNAQFLAVKCKFGGTVTAVVLYSWLGGTTTTVIVWSHFKIHALALLTWFPGSVNT